MSTGPRTGLDPCPPQARQRRATDSFTQPLHALGHDGQRQQRILSRRRCRAGPPRRASLGAGSEWVCPSGKRACLSCAPGASRPGLAAPPRPHARTPRPAERTLSARPCLTASETRSRAARGSWCHFGAEVPTDGHGPVRSHEDGMSLFAGPSAGSVGWLREPAERARELEDRQRRKSFVGSNPTPSASAQTAFVIMDVCSEEPLRRTAAHVRASLRRIGRGQASDARQQNR